MTKDEALKLALEALEGADMIDCDMREAITAIKEALANEALEKMAENARELGLDYEPPQEPVAWKLVPRDATDEMLKAMDECSTEGYDERLYAGHAASVFMAAVDAAPAPPQRTWVHLTNEEHTELAIECGCLGADWVFYGAVVERKVREKNT
jgi:hypothetical protein